jgi:hypothetical protein
MGQGREANDNNTEINAVDPGEVFMIGEFDWQEEMCIFI